MVEKLRSIRETNPDLYKEAWDKIPHKTQAAILDYESHHKPTHQQHSNTHHKASHEPSASFSHNYPTGSQFYEEHHRNQKTHSEARDWETPANSHPHLSSASHAERELSHSLSSPVLSASEEGHKAEPAKTKQGPIYQNREETEKSLKKSVEEKIPKAHQIMKQAVNEQHLPTTLQEVLLATTVYELELNRMGIDKLAK